MPRHSYKRTQPKKDPVYDSFEVAKLINYLMIGGKKTTSQTIVYGVLERFKEEKMEPVETLIKALGNVAPEHEVKHHILFLLKYEENENYFLVFHGSLKQHVQNQIKNLEHFRKNYILNLKMRLQIKVKQ